MIHVRAFRRYRQPDGTSLPPLDCSAVLFGTDRPRLLFRDGVVVDAEGYDFEICEPRIPTEPGWYALVAERVRYENEDGETTISDEVFRHPIIAWAPSSDHRCSALAVSGGLNDEGDLLDVQFYCDDHDHEFGGYFHPAHAPEQENDAAFCVGRLRDGIAYRAVASRNAPQDATGGAREA